ncbi:MAG: cytidylate kinase family protein, partial [Bacteroidales bacterium]|nr:cytidylate kinase family protein [Bacteroidales bacterium]
EDKIARISKVHNLTEREAEAYIQQSEKRRSEYYNYYTYKHWGAASSYDMCLNTSVLGVEKTIDIIEDVVRGLYSVDE